MPAKSRQIEPLTPEQQKLVEDNLGLAYKAANDCYRRFKNDDRMDADLLDDLVHIAVIGLAVAAQTYDRDVAEFSTHAMWKMRGELSHHVYALIGASRSKYAVHCVRFSEMAEHIATSGPDRTITSFEPAQHDPGYEAVDSHDELRERLKYTTEQQRDIFQRRYKENETYIQIGEQHGVTKERIRQHLMAGLVSARLKKKTSTQDARRILKEEAACRI